jgi:AmiR/NasT family two-component response regulator
MLVSSSANAQSVTSTLRGERPQSVDGLTPVEQFILEMLDRLDTAEVTADNLTRALDHSRAIGMAMGILMARHRLTDEQAFAALRRASQDSNRKLYLVAWDVVETGKLPETGS